MLAALEQIRNRSRSFYLRLTSKRVDQGLLKVPDEPGARARMRQQVLNGAYLLIDRSRNRSFKPGTNVVHILASGAMIPEAVAASNALIEEGRVRQRGQRYRPRTSVPGIPAVGL